MVLKVTSKTEVSSQKHFQIQYLVNSMLSILWVMAQLIEWAGSYDAK